MQEFKAFPKIERLEKVEMVITQKIHGTNAQILIKEIDTIDQDDPALIVVEDDCNDEDGHAKPITYGIYAGSRARWLTAENDNYGFYQFVLNNDLHLLRLLGPGTHFGEWAGPGINSGEGLTEKTFILFDHWRHPEDKLLPPQTKVVPVLYKGPIDSAAIQNVMQDLKTNGSKLVPGFMRPEGIVVQMLGTRVKHVFEPEETQWQGVRKPKIRDNTPKVDYSYLLQPIRLEKLLSKDEGYLRDYPKSLGLIAKEYFADLVAEGQITGTEDEISKVRKEASGLVFGFIKQKVVEILQEPSYSNK